MVQNLNFFYIVSSTVVVQKYVIYRFTYKSIESKENAYNLHIGGLNNYVYLQHFWKDYF